MILVCVKTSHAQKKWDGGAGSSAWNEPMNWYPDGIPGSEDDVILDNQWIEHDYVVELPGALQTTQVRTIKISPAGKIISLILGSVSTAVPGLALSALGDGMVIDNGGIFINASGSASGNPFQLAGKLKINNGGKYIHRTQRGNAELIDKLNNETGTETGIFEFDVPGTAGYTVSLTGNTFGSLSFKATSAGGNKSYSGSGTSNLLILGNLTVESGTLLSSTLTSEIILYGSLVVNGRINLHPVTAGTAGRSFVFAGRDVVFQGTGTISMNAFFRNLLVAKNASLTLETPCPLYYTPNTFICQGTIRCGSFPISGPGSFLLSDSARIVSGSDAGIWLTADQGNIRTAFRNFSPRASYQFNAKTAQVTGDGIPDTVAGFTVNNPALVRLSKSIMVTDSLELLEGILISDSAKTIILSGALIRSPVNGFGEINAGWEKSFVDGPIKIHTNNSIWQIIPSGAGNVYAPVKLKPTDTSFNEFIISYKAEPHPINELLPSLNSLKSSGYFEIKQEKPGSCKMALSYISADTPLINSEVMTAAILIDVNGQPKWNAALSTRSDAGSFGWLQTDTAIKDFGALAIGYYTNYLLPIDLVEFSAENTGSYNFVNWKAEQEGPYTEYVIERSPDGRRFVPQFSFRSQAVGISPHQWKDVFPIQPHTFYRLLMKSNGREIYSHAVKVNSFRRQAILYPNPASEWININFSDRSSTTELEIVNRSGIVLSKHLIKKNSCQIRVSDLKPGFYFARLRNANGTVTLPFTKY